VPPSSRRFGEFELDRARYELRRQGRALKLERIPMELLILLADKDGHVVSRREIVDRLWGQDVFVDTEHGINTAVRKIRTALREDGDRPRFIQTVQGKGYRFVPDGGNGNGGAAAVPERKPVSPATAELAAKATRGRGSPLVGSAVALFLLAGSLVGFNVGGIRTRAFAGSRTARIQSLAVLPLANLSGDSSQDYFADGMTDELITMLAKNPSLRVVSRTSVMQYKGVRRPVREIALELGVDGILEGSVARSGNRVHMTAQLIHAASDTHVWAESYDRDFKDALSLPSELSQTIAREVTLAATPAQPQRHVDPEAHDAYLRGRYFWFSESYDRSQEYFEKAIRLQPDDASAWSGLADSYVVRAVGLLVPPRAVIPKAREAAHRAVELDDTLPEAHNTLAGLYLFGDWDWNRADGESLRAIALNPGYAEARHLHGYVLAAQNRGEEALAEQRRSTEIDPFARPWALGFGLIHARRFEAAASELRLRAEARPQNETTRFILSDAYWHQGMWKESAEQAETAFLVLGDTPSADAVRHAFDAGGGTGVAEWALQRAEARARQGYVSPWELASLWARLKRKEEALRFLEEAYREHSAPMVFLQNEPAFDFLHSDERYRALVRKVGLPPAYGGQAEAGDR
jgi:TolB-like protein/DNA-binding winged helix-turn-helix (wHTH) protein